MAVGLGISSGEMLAHFAVKLDPAQTFSMPLSARTAEDLPVATNLLALRCSAFPRLRD